MADARTASTIHRGGTATSGVTGVKNVAGAQAADSLPLHGTSGEGMPAKQIDFDMKPAKTGAGYVDPQVDALLKIAAALGAIAAAMSKDEAPNLQFALEDYSSKFDWGALGIEEVESDIHGATVLRYGGHLWKRRTPINKYGNDIWYSRFTGKDQDGKNTFQTLVAFLEKGKESNVDPIPEKIVNAVKAAKARARAAAGKEE